MFLVAPKMVGFFLQLAAEKKTPILVQLEKIRPFLFCDGFSFQVETCCQFLRTYQELTDLCLEICQ